jgi:hypothetical protein
LPNKVRRVDSGRTGEVQELLDYSRRRWKKIKTKFWAVVGKPETMAIVGHNIASLQLLHDPVLSED